MISNICDILLSNTKLLKDVVHNLLIDLFAQQCEDLDKCALNFYGKKVIARLVIEQFQGFLQEI